MADWNEIRSKIGKAANKAVQKTSEMADSASKYVKLKSYDSKISSKYESLGRLTYKQIKSGESQAQRISELIDDIDSLCANRKQLADEIEADKQRRAEEKAAEKQQRAEEKASQE